MTDPPLARDLIALFEWPQEAHHLAQLLEQHWPTLKAALLAQDELLAALSKLLGHCETAFSGWPHSLGAVEVRDAARAALVKAKAS